MQESHPDNMTREQAENVGKLRREYFNSEAQMGRRREQLRAQGEIVAPPIRKTTHELLDRGSEILHRLSVEPDRRVRRALRDELESLAYALSHRDQNE